MGNNLKEQLKFILRNHHSQLPNYLFLFFSYNFHIFQTFSAHVDPGGALPRLAAGAPRPPFRDAAENSTDGDPRSRWDPVVTLRASQKIEIVT